MLPNSDLINDLTPSLTGLNNLSVQSATTEFFTNRIAYLTGESDTFDTAVSSIASNEAVHFTLLEAKSIIINHIEFVISSSSCYDNHAKVVVSETIHYSINGVAGEEIVVHDTTLYLNSDGVPVVTADAYQESFSGFHSASYVVDSGAAINSTSGGSGPCITYVAKNEVGYAESSSNLTKYGEWFGSDGLAWCAIFVAWCADQADIATSIIPKSASPLYMLNTLSGQNRFYDSAARGGTQTPQIGDLFFLGYDISAPSHVGIVVSVDVNNIYVVDGNWSDQVCYRSISRNATDLLGYGRPNYETSVHTYTYESTSTSHWGSCDHCGRTTNTSSHSYSGYESNAARHWQECIVCSYTTEKVLHTGGVYSSNSTYHWKNCTTCSVEMSKATHTLVQIGVGQGYRCSVCGYTTYASTID